MQKQRAVNFKNFKLIIRPADKPDAILVAFQGGVEVDRSGWETPTGERKRLEDDFKFMFSPAEAPSLRKGEYILHFRIPGKEQKFSDWVEKQKKMLSGIEDDR